MKVFVFCYCIGYGGCDWELVKADNKEEAWKLLKEFLETEEGRRRYPEWRTGTRCHTLVMRGHYKRVVEVEAPRVLEGDETESRKEYWRKELVKAQEALALNKQPTEKEIANDLFNRRPGEGFRLEQEAEYVEGKGVIPVEMCYAE